MRATMTLVLALLALAPQGGSLREAATLGHTQDDTLYAAFNKSYSLSPTGTIDSAEIITEFRRAVLIVREKTMAGDQSFSDAQLAKAVAPYEGLVTIIVRARLHPMNTFIKEPAYDLYVSTGPTSPPIASKNFKRDPIYAQGGGPLVGVRLEGSFPRADVQAAAAPMLIVADDKADIVWQARLDLSRYR